MDNPRSKFLSTHKNFVVDKGTIDRSGRVYSTGSWKLDALIGGGLVMGSMSEFMGSNGSGKSTVSLSTAGEVISGGGTVAYIDLERGLDKEWLIKNGVDIDGIDILRPSLAEDAFSLLREIVLENIYDYVVLDSVAALVTRAEMEGELGESHYGAVAKLLSHGLKVLETAYSIGKNNTTHITFINQIRDKIGSMFGGTKGTGGHSLPHYASTRLRFYRVSDDEQKSGEVLTKVQVKTEKNRFSKRSKEDITISSNTGLDTVREAIEAGIALGKINKSGAWFTFYDRPVDYAALKKEGNEKNPDSGYLIHLQGEDAARVWLQEHGMVRALNNEMREAILSAMNAQRESF